MLIEKGFLLTELLHIMFEDCETADAITVETNRRKTINKHLRKKIACKVKNKDTDLVVAVNIYIYIYIYIYI